MTHYETLGVPVDAVLQHIKAAYRRKASKAHPDKHGGDNKAMTELNKAYEVLSDPEKRAHYDRTGSDTRGPTVSDKAREMLVQTFAAVIDRGDTDPVAAATKMLNMGSDRANAHKMETLARIRTLGKNSGKVTVAKGDNLYQSIIDQQVRNLTSQLEDVESAIKAFAEALENVALYAFHPPVEDLDVMGTSNRWRAYAATTTGGA